jgi:excisionase family DNA binding protein
MKPGHVAANHPLMMTAIEIAEYLQFDRSTIYRLIRKGKIPCFKIGSNYRFDVHAIDRWMTDGQGEALKKNGPAGVTSPARAE